jgi:hypothetical protein
MTRIAPTLAVMRTRAAWAIGTRPPPLMLIAIGVVLVAAIGGAVLAARAVLEPPSAAQQMFEDIRYTAMFNGRDPDAVVRKAQQRVRLLMQDFGMSRNRAAEYVARIMIEQSGGLCSGI